MTETEFLKSIGATEKDRRDAPSVCIPLSEYTRLITDCIILERLRIAIDEDNRDFGFLERETTDFICKILNIEERCNLK